MIHVFWGQWRWRIYSDFGQTHVIDKPELWLANARPVYNRDLQEKQRETGARTRHAALSGNETTKIGQDLRQIDYCPMTEDKFSVEGCELISATLVHFRPDMTVWVAGECVLASGPAYCGG